MIQLSDSIDQGINAYEKIKSLINETKPSLNKKINLNNLDS